MNNTLMMILFAVLMIAMGVAVWIGFKKIKDDER